MTLYGLGGVDRMSMCSSLFSFPFSAAESRFGGLLHFACPVSGRSDQTEQMELSEPSRVWRDQEKASLNPYHQCHPLPANGENPVIHYYTC